jgi:periplasmic protein TonB
MQTSQLFDDWMDETDIQRNQIVFRNRNQLYGAYQIRRDYSRNVFMALLMASGLTVLPFILPGLLQKKTIEEIILPPITPPDIVKVIDLTPPVTPPTPPSSDDLKPKPSGGEQLAITVVDAPSDDDGKVPQQTDENLSGKSGEGPSDGGQGVDDGTVAGYEEKKDNSNDIFDATEIMPEFPGGENALLSFLQRNIQYPRAEKDAGIQGTVIVSFVIDKNGQVSMVSVARGVRGGKGLEKEAVRVVEKMPAWKPGTMSGRPVMVRYYLPVKFSLR